MRFGGCVVCSLAVALGCGEGGPSREEGTRERTNAAVTGPVVATVDGHAITLDDVKRTSRATGLSLEQALRRIEEEALLAAYAERSGYGQGEPAKHEVDAARVRALLRTTVEQGTAPSEIAEAEVRERFDSVRRAQEKPERRTVMHVVFRVEKPADEAKALRAAEGLFVELRPLDLSAITEKLSALPTKGERDGVSYSRETLNEIRKDGAFAAEFLQASFSVSAPALLAKPVKTSFGYHVIAVKSILPPVTVTLEEVESPIREKLSAEKRTKALEALLSDLRTRDAVRFHEEVISKELAKDEILGPGFQ